MQTRTDRTSLARDVHALGSANLRFWTTVYPLLGQELRRWQARASEIGDPLLRRQALGKLRAERFNAQTTATYAVLASRGRRASAVRAIVAYELLYDYLDGLSEQPAPDVLANGRQLHRALVATFERHGDDEDPFALHPQGDDGGYLAALVACARQAFFSLPAAEVVAPVARTAAARSREAQARCHAAALGGPALETWAAARDASGYDWWELAGAAISPLAVHALIAAAADAHTTHAEAEAIDAAYHPAIGALSTLLDSLVDHDRDVRDGSHRFIGYYPSSEAAAKRLGTIAREAFVAAGTLPHGAHHRIAVAGIGGHYLSAPEAAGAFAAPAALRVTESLQPLIGSTCTLFAAWRSAKRVKDRWERVQLQGDGQRSPWPALPAGPQSWVPSAGSTRAAR